MSNMRDEKKISMWKNLVLLLKCVVSSLSFAAVWAGLSLLDYPFGIWITIIGAVFSVLSLFYNLLLPLLRLK